MTDEEKQIEEMVCNACITKPTCTDMEKAKCMKRNFAICVIKQGYRRASDVAREIFEEIDRYVIRGITVGGEKLTLFNGKNYAELKKKYESEGGE